MPRWLLITVALAAFAAIMLAMRAIFYAAFPPFDTWMSRTLGADAWTAVVIGLAVIGGIYGFWPRDAAGRMRSPARRNRLPKLSGPAIREHDKPLGE